MSNARSRGYVFTINNPTGWDDADLERLKEHSLYLVYGKEKGENETLHYQGFVRFKHTKSFSRIKSFLPRAHIERQRGTSSQAATYCKKDGDFKEFGTLPADNGKQSSHERWSQIIELAETGQLETIRKEHPHVYFMYSKRIEQLRKRDRDILSGTLQHEWWVGPTGSGKSSKLWDSYPAHYQKSLTKWWDGYDNEEVVALEEFDPEAGKYLGRYLKIWADRYPFSPEIKGGILKQIRPKKIIVLSNYTIEECFERSQDRLPILRRFKVVHFYDYFN